MLELKNVKELLKSFGVKEDGVALEIALIVGLLIGCDTTSAVNSTRGMQLSGSGEDEVDIFFNERLQRRTKTIAPNLFAVLSEEQAEQILKFYNSNRLLLRALSSS